MERYYIFQTETSAAVRIWPSLVASRVTDIVALDGKPSHTINIEIGQIAAGVPAGSQDLQLNSAEGNRS